MTQPQRYYDDWLKAFIEYASYGEAPLTTLFWTGVSTIAGALRRRVYIDQRYFQWVPNFYIILVAPPGIISKSTTASIGINLLRQVPDIKFGPQVVTWQALVEAMAASTEMVLDKSTGEYLTMSAITISSSEFGNLLNPQDKQMVDILVDLWDGQVGSFEKRTKSSGNDTVQNPWINIIACTTPSWIAGNFPEYMIGGGFTSRCVFVFAEEKRQLVAYPADVAPKDFHETERKLVHDLEIISQMVGEMELSDSAKAWGQQWYEYHWNNKPVGLDNGQFGGYLARKQTHIHKLAMVISASKTSSLIIDRSSLEFAEAMVSSLESTMPKVFERIGQNDNTRGQGELVDLIRKNGKMEQSALYALLFRTMSFQDFQLALLSAERAGHVRLFDEGGKKFVVPTQEKRPENPASPLSST